MTTAGRSGATAALSCIRRMAESRNFVDADGISWEIFGEGDWNTSLALVFDRFVARERAGLLFISSREMRRLWPFPGNWRVLDDVELDRLCRAAEPL